MLDLGLHFTLDITTKLGEMGPTSRQIHAENKFMCHYFFTSPSPLTSAQDARETFAEMFCQISVFLLFAAVLILICFINK